MPLSDESRATATTKLLKAKLRRDGIRLSATSFRELGALASESGVPKHDLRDLIAEMLPEFIADALGASRVIISVSFPEGYAVEKTHSKKTL